MRGSVNNIRVMAEKMILQLSFQPQTTWGYKILNCFSDEMRNSYKDGFARELMLSITQKMELFLYIIPQLNQYAEKLKNALENDFENVEGCLKNGFAYSGIEDDLRIAFMSYLDAAIFECDSLCELVEKFYCEIKKNTLGSNEKLSLQDKAAEKSVDIQWRDDLRSIRNDWIHNYAGWLAFKKNGKNFEIVIEIPSKVRKNFKDGDVDVVVINAIFNGVNQYLDFAQNTLIEEIRNGSNIGGRAI